MGYIKLSQVIFVILLFVVNLSSSNPVESEDQSTLLTARVELLQAKMDHLITQLEEEKTLRSDLQALNVKLSIESQKQGAKIDFLMAQNIEQEKEINLLKNHRKNDLDNVLTLLKSQQSKNMNNDPSSPRLLPSSCQQLSTVGHYLNGIYLVANPNTKKIQTVYCEFGSTLSETLLGNVDVKSKSAHFYVQRNSDFVLNDAVLTFDLERLNDGGAMNTTSGVFTAPVDGIYHFEFSAIKDGLDPIPAYVNLRVNGLLIGTAYGTNIPNYYPALSSINAQLRLKTGDQVSLYKSGGNLKDDGRHYTHFSGWLVEEDLVMA